MFITTYVCYDCKLASVAEWIRQCTRNPEIVGSIPLEGKLFLNFFLFTQRLIPGLESLRGLSSICPHLLCHYMQLCIIKLWRHFGGTLSYSRSREKSPCKLIFKIFKSLKHKFSPTQKNFFVSFFFLNSCINLQVRPQIIRFYSQKKFSFGIPSA